MRCSLSIANGRYAFESSIHPTDLGRFEPFATGRNRPKGDLSTDDNF
jgi:hypothetical protein